MIRILSTSETFDIVLKGRSAAMEDWSKTFTWAAKDMQIVEDVMQRYGLI